MNNVLNFLLLANLISAINIFNAIPNLMMHYLFNEHDLINGFILLIITIVVITIGGCIIKVLTDKYIKKGEE